ncbi:MAG: Mur ligase domain-containing protein, partial [Victivallaceae bacterium]
MDAQIRNFDDLKNKYEHVHFIGVGGAGMAPLAHLVLGVGCIVSGSDALWSRKLDELQEAGATVFAGHEAAHFPDTVDLVVISSAIEEVNPELALARQRGVKVLRRGEFLAVLCGSFSRCVAIGGSHGKTSVTAMLSYLLRQCNVDCGFMIGGGVNQFPSFRLGNGDIFVTEVDESDGTISCTHPEFGVLNNAEDDHAWSLGGVEQLKNIYRKFILQSRNFVCFNDNDILDLIPEEHENNLIIVPDESLISDNFIGFQRRN